MTFLGMPRPRPENVEGHEHVSVPPGDHRAGNEWHQKAFPPKKKELIFKNTFQVL